MHHEAPDDAVRADLLSALEDVLGQAPKWRFSQVLRWRRASAARPDASPLRKYHLRDVHQTRAPTLCPRTQESLMTSSRRLFILAAAVSATAIATTARAQSKLDEKDPQAVALSYVADASHADLRKFAKYSSGQNCAGCALYQGKSGDAVGNCPLYAGKQVSAKGWCSAWVKKA
jgi:hypothetical protein